VGDPKGFNMVITDVRGELYEYELARPIADANMVGSDGIVRATQRGLDMAVRVSTDAGIEGVAIGHAAGLLSVKDLSACVIGHDPRAVRGLWQRMVDRNFKLGTQGAVGLGIAVIDNALWDLRAKASGLPLWKELGATAGRVRAYASGIDLGLSDSELQEFYAHCYQTLGITAGKLKVGLDIDDDLRRLRLVEAALGGRAVRPVLLVDANEYWSPKQAIRRMRALEEEFDVAWCEEPARRWDYRGLRQVSRAIRAAVASGENLRDLADFVPLLTNEALDVVQVNPYSAGITTCLRIADLAYGFERPVSVMNSPGRFGAHLAAALPHHTMMEVLDLGKEAVFTSDSVIKGGWVEIGDTPGVGITLDDEMLRRRGFAGRELLQGWHVGTRGPLAGVREGKLRPVG